MELFEGLECKIVTYVCLGIYSDINHEGWKNLRGHVRTESHRSQSTM